MNAVIQQLVIERDKHMRAIEHLGRAISALRALDGRAPMATKASTRVGQPPRRNGSDMRQALIQALQRQKHPMTQEHLVASLRRRHARYTKMRNVVQIAAMCLHNAPDFKHVTGDKWALR